MSARAKFTVPLRRLSSLTHTGARVYVASATTIARVGVSLLLRIGNPAKRERALTSAYKLLVDISSVTSLPAMCRLVSEV